MKKNIEVLSPAGSYDSFLAAINAGADAIYLGGSAFGARAFSNNFSEEELLRALDVAHIHDKKVYLTVNTLLKNNEMSEQLYSYLKPYYENGLDAVIVQDMGVLNFVKEYFPQLHIHASTQMSTTGALGAKLLKELGASRIVTARELNIGEIKDIDNNVDIEIEGFVHGALCYCYSGQCLMSSLIGGRSGNRGRCAQPCRLPYDVIKNDSVIGNDNEKYVLSPKDMCSLSILPQVIDAGVDSLKIEGRMKSSEYTAGVVSMYRKYVDKYLENGSNKYKVSDADMNTLKDLYNRGGFTNGYYVDETGKSMISLTRPNHQGTKALEVISNNKGCINCRVLEDLDGGDVFEIGNDFAYTNKYKVSKNDKIILNVPHKYDLKNGDIIYRTKNNALMDEIKTKYIDTQKKELLEGKLELFIGDPASLSICLLDSNGKVRASATTREDIIEPAMKQPMDIERVKKQLSKTGGTRYTFENLTVHMDDNIFIPIQKLNDLRRNAIEAMEKQLCDSYKRSCESDHSLLIKTNFAKADGYNISKADNNIKINVSLENKGLLDTVLSYKDIEGIYLELSEYQDILELANAVLECKKLEKKVYFIMPHIFRLKAKKYFDDNIKEILELKADGFVIKNLEEIQYFRNYIENIEKTDNNIVINLILDYNVYTFNSLARDEYKKLEMQDKLRILYDTAPIELNEKELKHLNIFDSELVVYGYIPMMISTQCVNKTVGYCDAKKTVIYLKDRKNKKFAIKNNCTYCYNTIYNTSPIYIIDKTSEVLSLAPKKVRIILTYEDKNTAREVIEDAIKAYVMHENVENSLKDFTRGHFLRGVD
ncbi:peptidase U32 family protein [[Clostridium] fimetarium]|uniref:Putative protease n=1 Tax=[Clostridium] fimetarium TaxID=99656 RepID=A0A1I0QMM6_9FIRM|nr:U32 family peptidase [[Clostridium] fimetarium]SEW28332.1 putative protease [[Clostridium] fimetarium]